MVVAGIAEVDAAQKDLRTYRLEDPGETMLHVSYRPVDTAGACVLGLHGYSEHGARYAHFAKYLAEKNIESFWLDLPGHGRSGGRRADISSVQDYVYSFERFYLSVRKQRLNSRFHVFAHSLGGLVVLRWLQTRGQNPGILSVSLSSPLIGIQRFHGWKMSILHVLTAILPNFTLPNESELGASSLTHDPSFEESRRKDPLIKPEVTINWVRAFLKAREKLFSEIDRLNVPIGIFQAHQELVTDREEAIRFFQLLRAEKQYKEYQDAYHELLNETNRAEVMGDIWSWISTYEPRHF